MNEADDIEGREVVLARVRGALAERRECAEYPDYDLADLVAAGRLSDPSDWENFARNFAAVNGRALTAVDELAAFLEQGGHRTGYCDPELMAVVGDRLAAAGFAIDTTYDRSRFDDYGFGITRATGAIAETGTVILSDEETADRLGALTPWVHVAVLDPARLVRTVGEAIAAFGDSVNIIWATGPSKTADVEGILIEGVHGPGEQICLRLE